MKRWLAWTALTLGGLAQAAAPQLRVEQGTLNGKAVNSVQQFLGVPFAAPPVGPLRWQPPQPPVWSGQRDATQFGPACAQGDGGSEDCLTLNIYRPPNAKNAPLLVWVHGGFFTGGDAASLMARRWPASAAWWWRRSTTGWGSTGFWRCRA